MQIHLVPFLKDRSRWYIKWHINFSKVMYMYILTVALIVRGFGPKYKNNVLMVNS